MNHKGLNKSQKLLLSALLSLSLTACNDSKSKNKPLTKEQKDLIQKGKDSEKNLQAKEKALKEAQKKLAAAKKAQEDTEKMVKKGAGDKSGNETPQKSTGNKSAGHFYAAAQEANKSYLAVVERTKKLNEDLNASETENKKLSEANKQLNQKLTAEKKQGKENNAAHNREKRELQEKVRILNASTKKEEAAKKDLKAKNATLEETMAQLIGGLEVSGSTIQSLHDSVTELEQKLKDQEVESQAALASRNELIDDMNNDLADVQEELAHAIDNNVALNGGRLNAAVHNLTGFNPSAIYRETSTDLTQLGSDIGEFMSQDTPILMAEASLYTNEAILSTFEKLQKINQALGINDPISAIPVSDDLAAVIALGASGFGMYKSPQAKRKILDRVFSNSTVITDFREARKELLSKKNEAEKLIKSLESEKVELEKKLGALTESDSDYIETKNRIDEINKKLPVAKGSLTKAKNKLSEKYTGKNRFFAESKRISSLAPKALIGLSGLTAYLAVAADGVYLLFNKYYNHLTEQQFINVLKDNVREAKDSLAALNVPTE